MARLTSRSVLMARMVVVAVVGILAAGVSVSPVSAADGEEVISAPDSLQPEQLGTTDTESKQRVSRPAEAAPAPESLASCGAVSIGAGASPAGGYLPLSLFGIAPISGVGDETVTSFSVPSFTYAGQSYTQLQVSSNGYAQAGSTANNSFINQNFPDPNAPNNTLAPFWTDLNPNVAGALRVGTLTDGSDTWIVMDWDGVAEFSTAGNTHSFQIYIGIDGDTNPGQDISYVYGPNTGNGDGGFLTVGAENRNGTSGGVTYYNGAGSLPTNGTQLVVTSSPGLVADFTASPASGSAPLHVEFDASTSTDDGTIDAYDWDFGDAGTGTGITTSHDYAAGVYTATLQVTDNLGNTCSTSEQISVSGGFSVDDVSVNEAAGTATFTVTRPGGPAASVDVAASSGSATASSDFSASAQTLNFTSGETSKPYVVTINQDSLDEPKETYTVSLSNPVDEFLADDTGTGTIVDDDAEVRIRVSDNNVVEGDAGSKVLNFKVRLDQVSGRTVKVVLHTADGSALAPSDYTSKTVLVTFAPGETLHKVAVSVNGDITPEPNEAFFVLLDSPVHGKIRHPNGSGGIIDND